MGSAVATIAQILLDIAKVAPVVIQTANDAKPFAEAIAGLFTGAPEPTQAQIGAALASVQALSAQLQGPQPVDRGA